MTSRVCLLPATALIGALLAAGAASPDVRSVSLRVSGGWANIDGGDFADGIRGSNVLIRSEYLLVGGSLRPPRSGFGLRAELEAELSPRFGVALGLEYLRAGRAAAVEYDAGVVRCREEIRPSLSAVPLTLTAGYRLPIWGRLSLRVSAGPGLYFLRVRGDRSYLFGTEWIDDAGRESWRAAAVRPGIQGALALEAAVGGRLSAFIEGGGRWVRWSDVWGPWTLTGSSGLTGDYARSGDRTLWRYDYAGAAGSYSLWALSDAEPALPRASGEEPARIDLSGLALRAGLRVAL